MKPSAFFTDVMAQISQKLEQGVLPWRKSWRVGLPSNFISKRPYSGINFFALSGTDFPSPFFLTFLQVKQRNASVKSGAKGHPIVFWKIIESDDDFANQRGAPLLRISYVFNLADTSLFNLDEMPRHLECESVIKNMSNPPEIRHNFARCYYSISDDYVSVPVISDFCSQEEYYISMFHELIHATGHPSRLNRDMTDRGMEGEIVEELVAELGAAFIAARCGLSLDKMTNSVSYIDGWLNLSRHRQDVFLRAIHQSRLAAEYILGENLISK